jgi:elongation factor P
LVSTSDFKKGIKVEFKGEPYQILDFQHVKMGRGGAFVRVKMRGLKSGRVVEETFNSGEKLPRAHMDARQMQFLYKQDDQYFFMDMESYEQTPLTKEQLGDAMLYLKESMIAEILYHKGEPLLVELPIFVELVVAETDSGFKGDTASGGGKPAVLETGASIRVPFHINQGEKIKVDTRTGEYIERVK